MTLEHVKGQLSGSWAQIQENTPYLQQTLGAVHDAYLTVNPEGSVQSERISHALGHLYEAYHAISGLTLAAPQYRDHLEAYLTRFSRIPLSITASFVQGALPEAKQFSPGSQEKLLVPGALPEKDEVLFKNRVPLLEQRAAQGEYGGPPLRFLAAQEIEFGVLEGSDATIILEKIQEDDLTPEQRNSFEEGQILPPSQGTFSSFEEIQDKQNALRRQARTYIEALQPQSADEAERKQQWLRSIESFTTTDLINFQLYLEFSQPTLGTTAPPKGATHDEMIAHTENSGWLEFRFGKDTLQQGYYDNPGVSEIRIAPCPPGELTARETIIMQRLADIAAEHGALTLRANSHLNISVYTPPEAETGSETAEQQQWQPIINPDDPVKQQVTLDVISGLSAGIEDGAWMTNRRATNRLLFGQTLGQQDFEISPVRNPVRILEDYFELRDPRLQESAAHGLTWAMSAVMYGLQQGSDTIARNGYAAAQITHGHKLIRTAAFEKDRDLQLQRATERAIPIPGGGFQADRLHNASRGKILTDDIFGVDFMNDSEAYDFNRALLYSLDVDGEGRMSLNKGRFRGAYHVMAESDDDGPQAPLAGLLDFISLDEIEQLAENFIGRDAVRYQPTPTISASPRYPGLEPDQWQQRWNNSPIMQQAFGEQTAAFAEKLNQTATEHYVYIDPNDDKAKGEAYRLAMEIYGNGR